MVSFGAGRRCRRAGHVRNDTQCSQSHLRNRAVQGEAEAFIEISQPLAIRDAVQAKAIMRFASFSSVGEEQPRGAWPATKGVTH